ncbi:LiaF domain-containing protein [Lactobacillus sp. ESL0677]|uniref:LiaF transmembrane domain-containing protein n=1 Tax=Lactobacillus sp. ESL0677 TaxID=2983208 RepID=UPI0023F6DA7F|nr:LiaF domain-containing protein [Lactobacillus sp. ESL0677]WEV36938.1 LiaF-related protein [Lactobacillus sp. ESL0677]
MKKQKIRELFWGIALLGAAIFLIMNQLNLFSFRLNFWTIFWTIIFGACLIEGLTNRSIGGTIFSIALLLIVYAQPLKITKIVPWTVLLAACLITGGLHMIFPHKRHHTHVYINGHNVNGGWSKFGTEKSFHADHVFDSSSQDVDEQDIVVNQKLSDVSRYVRSQSLRSVTINSLMGDAKVYLDAAKPATDTIIVDINSSMSDVSLYIPLSWQVDDQMSSIFGDVEINGSSNGGGPTLVLTGNSKFGDVEINYV